MSKFNSNKNESLNTIRKKVSQSFSDDFLSLIGNIKNYIAGDFFLKAVGIITVPIFTRLLSPEDYGILAIYESIFALAIVFIGLNMNSAIVFFTNENEKESKSFIYNIYLFSILIAIIEILIAYYFRSYISSIFKIEDSIILFAIIAAALQLPFTFYLRSLQAIEKSKHYVRINILKTIFTVLGSLLLVYLLKNEKYLGKIYSQIFVSGCVFALISVIFVKNYRSNFSLGHIKYALVIGIPLIPHTLSGFINQFFDKIMINSVINTETAGIYAVAVTISSIIRMVSVGMNKAWSARFYKNMAKKNYLEISKTATPYFSIFIFISLLYMTFHKELFFILVDREYLMALNITPILILSAAHGPLYTLYANHSFYSKKTFIISFTTIFSSLLNIILNSIFIPRYGFMAAAYTTLISSAVNFIFHYCIATYVLKYKIISLFKVYKYLLLLIISTIAILYINNLALSYFINLLLRFISIIILSLCIFFFGRKDKWI